MVLAEDTAESPRMKPTDISMPPEMMTNVSAQARRREVVARWMMLWKLLSAKKFLPVREKTTTESRRKKKDQLRANMAKNVPGAFALAMAADLSPIETSSFSRLYIRTNAPCNGNWKRRGRL
jgi:hypothetical protein